MKKMKFNKIQYQIIDPKKSKKELTQKIQMIYYIQILIKIIQNQIQILI
jgi:hypothetical protein